MAYNLVQTFFVNSNAVNGASQVLLTGIELFVKTKPGRAVNTSGLVNPSIIVQICPADRDQPYIAEMVGKPLARATWDDITETDDATTATLFSFTDPIPLATDSYYGVFIQVTDDGYTLWDSIQGHRLVGTNSGTSGPNGRYDGYLFQGSGDGSWRALNGRDLKFGVNVARFSANTVANVGFVAENYEFLSIDRKVGNFYINERVFQDAGSPTLTVPVSADLPGTLLINANSTRIVGNGTSFNTTLAANSFIITSLTSDVNTFAIGVVNNIVNSTVLFLKERVPLTSSGYNGKYRSGVVAEVFETRPYYDRTNEIVLFKSTANSTVGFITGGLNGVTVSNTGAGYANTNVVRVQNPGGTEALYAISTNATGSIVSLTLVQPGAGFTAPIANSAVRIEVSDVDPTLKSGNPGANATIVVANNQVGLKLRGHVSGAVANIISVDNKAITEIYPRFQELSSADARIDVDHAYSNGNVIGVSNALYRDTTLNAFNHLRDYPAVLASKSNEAVANNGPSSRFNVSFTVDRPNTFLFDTPIIESQRAHVMTYENDINNDATNEHTNRGNATSKYIGRRIGFGTEVFSEDLMVYVRGTRPANTDIKVYAKFHNSVDDEPFDDKLWTELDRTSPDVFTNPYDTATTEMSFTVPQYPKVESELAGFVTTSNNNANVNGQGTSFSNTLIGRLVRIYSPLNPSNHQVVSVQAVTNTTFLTLGAPVVNNSVQESVVGNGLKMQLLEYTGTAFNNILGDNVIRYHTITNQAEIDGFDTFAIKIVLLSDNKYRVPTVDDIRMIGLSA